MKDNILFEDKLYRTILNYFTDLLYMKNTRSSKIISPIMISNFNIKDVFFLYSETFVITKDFQGLKSSEIKILQDINTNLSNKDYKKLYNTGIKIIDELIYFIKGYYCREKNISDFDNYNDKILFLIFSYGTDKIKSWRDKDYLQIFDYISNINLEDIPNDLKLYTLQLRVIIKYKGDKKDDKLYSDMLEVLKIDPTNIHYKCILARYLIANIGKIPGNELYEKKGGDLLYSCVLKNTKLKHGYINIFYGYYCMYNLHNYIQAEEMFRIGIKYFETQTSSLYYFGRLGLVESIFIKKQYKDTLLELNKIFSYYMEDDDFGDGSYKKVIISIIFIHCSIMENNDINIHDYLIIIDDNIKNIPMLENNVGGKNIQIITNLYPILEIYENIATFILKRDTIDTKNKGRLLGILENLLKLINSSDF